MHTKRCGLEWECRGRTMSPNVCGGLKLKIANAHIANIHITHPIHIISIIRANIYNIMSEKATIAEYNFIHTIRILEKFNKPSGVKSGVPSSINDKSVRYMPKYGIHGGSQRCNASRITRNLPSAQTTAWSLLIVCFICLDVSVFC